MFVVKVFLLLKVIFKSVSKRFTFASRGFGTVGPESLLDAL